MKAKCPYCDNGCDKCVDGFAANVVAECGKSVTGVAAADGLSDRSDPPGFSTQPERP